MTRQTKTSGKRCSTGAIIPALLLALFVPALAVPPAPLGQPVGAGDVRVLPIADHADVLPGATRPRRAVTVGASFDARLMRVLVCEGDRVSAGQVIARLDDRVAAASLALAQEEADQRAQIERAGAQFDRVSRALARATDAHARGGVSDEELDDAHNDVAVARAELAQAVEAQAAAAKRAAQAAARLEEHLIRAPFDGTIVRLRNEEGAVLRTADPIADLTDPDLLSADLYLPAATALTIELGKPYAIAIDNPIGRVVWARARYVEPRVDPTSNTMRTVFDFETPAGLIPAGLLVRPAERGPSEADLAFMRTRVPRRAVAQAAEPAGPAP